MCDLFHYYCVTFHVFSNKQELSLRGSRATEEARGDYSVCSVVRTVDVTEWGYREIQSRALAGSCSSLNSLYGRYRASSWWSCAPLPVGTLGAGFIDRSSNSTVNGNILLLVLRQIDAGGGGYSR